MKFAAFCQYLQKLEGISSRLEMTAVLAEIFQKLPPTEIVPACYLMQGQLLPPYTALEFQIAVKTVIKAGARLLPSSVTQQDTLFGAEDFSTQEARIEQEYKSVGDLGKVIESVIGERDASSGSAHSISQVYELLLKIARESGAQSQQRKLDGLVSVLQLLDSVSAKFVVRVVLGRLRLGFSDMTMIDAMSWAMAGDKSERDLLEQAYQKKADIGKLAEVYLQQADLVARRQALQEYKVEVGVPVIPALCQRLNSAAEMIEKMEEVIAEPKYDGLRVQIHVQKHKTDDSALPVVRTFTRNLEETSEMFPELLEAVADLQCESCILDAEAIGYDPDSGELLPFQQTIQRKRKHDVSEKAKEVPVRFYVFDALAIDGEDLLQTPLVERKARLAKLFDETKTLYHSPQLRTKDPVELHEYHEKNLAEGLEGVVVKQLNSVYQSGRKGWSWVKMKEAEGTTGKLSDTIDVVVMGYYYGRGKRAEFGIGAILVGVKDEESNTIVTIAKIGTGLTDESLRETKKKCDALLSAEMPTQFEVPKMLVPDVWCLPGFVIEVAADELTVSPLHTAKIALRFPRLVRFREDKTQEQITTVSELKKF